MPSQKEVQQPNLPYDDYYHINLPSEGKPLSVLYLALT